MDPELNPTITTYGKANVTFDVVENTQGQAYLAKNGEGSTLGLVVLSEWWGMNVNICETTELFGTLGFRALALDIYRGQVGINRESAGHLRQGLDFENAVKDIAGAVKFLKETQKCTKVGVIGFCMGGALALAAASRPTGLAASVAYYGIPNVEQFKPSDLNIPVLGNMALNDHAKGFSDQETVKAYEKLALEAGKDLRIDFYDAEHSFNNKDTPRYNEIAALKAREESVKFLKQHLGN